MLSVEQRTEMVAARREMERTGRPEIAAEIQIGLDADKYTLGAEEEAEIVYLDRPPTHGPGSGKIKWQEYAAAVSDFDEEIITSTQKKDLILMLEAHDL